MNTPVALFLYKRPVLLEKVFRQVARVKPRKLLLIADAPRSSQEAKLCEEAQSTATAVDWECEVLKNFSDEHLGCKLRMSSGLDWVFEQCEEAIILEDDTLPNESFFQFCGELLERFRHDERVMLISGDNFQTQSKRLPESSYYFSIYNHIWGWASWRRAWRFYDVEMELWKKLKQTKWLEGFSIGSNFAQYWRNRFEEVSSGLVDTWDYQWTFACWVQHGLSILPTVNLISNLGIDVDSTHPAGRNGHLANLPTQELTFPLRHPTEMVQNYEADVFTQQNIFGPRNKAQNHLISNWIRRKIEFLAANRRING
jgi:hypothetical protein